MASENSDTGAKFHRLPKFLASRRGRVEGSDIRARSSRVLRHAGGAADLKR
jgi:hypothetical protein